MIINIISMGKSFFTFGVIFWFSLLLFAKPPLGFKATALIFVASHCPCTEPHKALISSLVKKHSKEGVRFYAIFSNRDEDRELIERFMRQTDWHFEPFLDTDGSLQKTYNAKMTPEVILLDTKGKTVYRGAIDDSVPNMGQIKHPYLQTALEQLLSGEKVEPASTPPYGCYIVR